MLPDVAREAVHVVVRAPQRSIWPDHDTTDRPDATPELIDLVDDGQRPLFVRNGQIAAGKSERRQRAQCGVQALGPDGERNVGARELILAEEVVVEGR